jgi:hypothetical protein
VKDIGNSLKRKYRVLAPHLNERSRRLFAAVEAKEIGYGGISLVSEITKISRKTIHVGLREISEGAKEVEGIRRPGGGRKSAAVKDPELESALESLVDPLTRGDPESPIRWTCKSTARLSLELHKLKYKACPRVVSKILKKLGYSLQANQKTVEGQQHPDRNAQFEFINSALSKQMKCGNPVVSVDTKKKELVGNFKNNGQKWHKKNTTHKVMDHDFPDPDIPRAHPYGVYDVAKNMGLVNIGTTHDTASFAVASIRKWWRICGRKLYPSAKTILITADAGGSNGWRIRLWKWELQQFADETGLSIQICHFPPGTSKWNKIEHRLFSFISQNWRGEPLTSYETIIKLVESTTTKTGLVVKCKLDRKLYPKGQTISDEQMKSLKIKKNAFHGEWNYTILPR